MKTILVAIAGGSGSGKTWLARELQRRLRPHAALLSLDDFYHDLAGLPLAERAKVNFDHPEAIDWELFHECLAGIREGGAVTVPRYDFSQHTREPRGRRWPARPVVLVEGLWPWRRSAVARLYSLRVFRAGGDEVCLARRLERDVRERGRSEDSVHTQWHSHVQPMYRRFVAPQAATAHVRLPREVPEWRLDRIAARIRRLADVS